MFGLFGGSKSTKVIDKPFSAFLGGLHFATVSLPNAPKLDVATNLQGVLYICGEQEIAVIQNQAVTGHQHELLIDRSTGDVSDRIDSTLLLLSFGSKKECPFNARILLLFGNNRLQGLTASSFH